ncbi:MAG: IS110 family transposase [Acidobacteriota bacterium]|nr:IS110 family transposase [Acidobacteriota bacterium]
MRLYAGIDLHANNSYLAVIDETDELVEAKRLPNDIESVRRVLEPYRENLAGIAVESTFNWYWLVDGLEESGYKVHLVNTLAAQQYKGLKYTDDKTDARWLAHMLRLGILPTGWICPREKRAVRDLLRRRSQLVRQKTANRLGLRNVLERSGAKRLSGNALKRVSENDLTEWIEDPNVRLSMQASLAVIDTLSEQIERIEKTVAEHAVLDDSYRLLTSIKGIGATLASTIQYETGDIGRFSAVSNYVSYCRLVRAERNSNQRVKGLGLRKNGNAYLSWAFHEAAHFAVRFQPDARRWYEKKRSRTCPLVAIRALAHKLARAAYFMMRDQVPYEPKRLFG